MSPITVAALVFGSLSFAWTLCGLFAVAGLRGSRARSSRGLDTSLPPVSVLKPLCGADAELERCLESCFAQDHPDFELVFSVESADDPALAVVERVRARHPRVKALVVVHRGGPRSTPRCETSSAPSGMRATISSSSPTPTWSRRHTGCASS